MNIVKRTALCTLMLATTFNLMSSDSPSWWTSIKNIVSNWNDSLVATIRQNPKTSAAIAAGGITAAALACYLYNQSCTTAQIDLNNRLLNAVANNAEIQEIERLLANGADVDAINDDGWRPLSYAVVNGNVNIAELLFQNGASVDKAMLLPLAASSNQIGMVQWLFNHAANMSNINGTLYIAVQNNNLEIMRLLLENGANVHEAAYNGYTLLHRASRDGSTDIVRLLLSMHVNVNAADPDGRTPLHDAARNGNLEIGLLLLNNGANINAADDSGDTPLHVAAKENNINIAQELIRSRAHVNTRDDSGKTPLHYAVKRKNLEMVKSLLNHGADVNAADNFGSTPLHLAAERRTERRDIEMVQFLLDSGADALLKNSNGQTPKDIAAHRGYNDITKILQDWEDVPMVKSALD